MFTIHGRTAEFLTQEILTFVHRVGQKEIPPCDLLFFVGTKFVEGYIRKLMVLGYLRGGLPFVQSVEMLSLAWGTRLFAHEFES